MTTIITARPVVREEIISIPEKIFHYTVARLKFDYPGGTPVEERGIKEGVDKLSGIKLGDQVGIIGYKREKTSSSLFLWAYPYCEDSYRVKICCGFFHAQSAIYEKISISFPSFGLTIFSPDQSGIISLVLEGLRSVTPSGPFRKVK